MWRHYSAHTYMESRGSRIYVYQLPCKSAFRTRFNRDRATHGSMACLLMPEQLVVPPFPTAGHPLRAAKRSPVLQIPKLNMYVFPPLSEERNVVPQTHPETPLTRKAESNGKSCSTDFLEPEPDSKYMHKDIVVNRASNLRAQH